MPDLLATVSDLATHLQLEVATSSAQQALEVATGAVQDECGWPILQRTTVATVTPERGEPIDLDTRHVTAVSVVEAGVPLVEGTDFTWSSTGRLLRVTGTYRAHWASTVTITYTHGWPLADVPQTIRGVVLMVAARNYDNPAGLRTEQIGHAVEGKAIGSPSAFAGSALTDPERAALARYRLAPLVV